MYIDREGAGRALAPVLTQGLCSYSWRSGAAALAPSAGWKGRALPLPVDTQADDTAQPHCPSDDVFAQALIADSNSELDWLWVYVQVTDAFQRRYCLERALVINPQSELAGRELARLTANRHT